MQLNFLIRSIQPKKESSAGARFTQLDCGIGMSESRSLGQSNKKVTGRLTLLRNGYGGFSTNPAEGHWAGWTWRLSACPKVCFRGKTFPWLKVWLAGRRANLLVSGP
jgi:hypothetical protein